MELTNSFLEWDIDHYFFENKVNYFLSIKILANNLQLLLVNNIVFHLCVYFYFSCMSVLPPCIEMGLCYTTLLEARGGHCIPGTGVIRQLQLPVGTGNQTLALWKNSQCS